MKMKLYQTLSFKFDNPNWANNPEFALMDSILEQHPGLIHILEGDAMDRKQSDFGR